MGQIESHHAGRSVEAEHVTNFGVIQLISAHWDEPIVVRGVSDCHHLQLSLLPEARASQIRFPGDWGPRRFERMGEAFFFPAGHEIHVKASCRRQHSICCSFNPKAAAHYFETTMEWTDNRLMASLDLANATVRSLLFKIGQEMRAPSFAGGEMIELLMGQVLIEVSRHLLDVDPVEAGGGLSPWRMKLIDQRLRDSDAQPALGELAALCNLSVRHLTRAFRVCSGRSIGDYMSEHRMERARMLLLAGMSVTAVSQQMGFSAPNNFTAAFRRRTGEAPREFMLRTLRWSPQHRVAPEASRDEDER